MRGRSDGTAVRFDHPLDIPAGSPATVYFPEEGETIEELERRLKEAGIIDDAQRIARSEDVNG